MNRSKSSWVCSPRASSVEHLVQVGQHVLDPLIAAGSRVGQRLLHAAELAVEHLAPQQVAQLLERLRAPRRSASRSRPAPGSPARCRAGSASSSASRSRASSDGSGNSSARSWPTALSSSARACSRVPSSRPRSRSSRRRSPHLAAAGRRARAGPACPAGRAAAGRAARRAGWRRRGSRRPSRRARPARRTAGPAGRARRWYCAVPVAGHGSRSRARQAVSR